MGFGRGIKIWCSGGRCWSVWSVSRISARPDVDLKIYLNLNLNFNPISNPRLQFFPIPFRPLFPTLVLRFT